MIRSGAALALVLAGCSRGSATPPPSSSTSTSASTATAAPMPSSSSKETATWLDAFPAYPGARHLCSEHVTGNSMHIEWSSYATVDAPASVVAFYRDRAKVFHEEKVEGDASFAADADRKLTVSAADGTYPRCAKAPTPTERAVIVVSRAIR